jgi:DNA-directed RNA polymerase specialized sigma24 family protein
MEASGAEGADSLLGRVKAGDPAALEQLLARERPFMRRVVEVRLDGRLRARLDPSDVVQEAQLEVARRLPDYQQAAKCLDISPSSADRAWRYARAWLYAAMAGDDFPK